MNLCSGDTTKSSSVGDASKRPARQCSVIVVGGGPAGLACALSLARLGVRGIAVIESSDCYSNSSGPAADQTKAYSYRIDGHGFRFFEEMGIADQLQEIAGKNPKEMRIWAADGSSKVMGSPLADRNGVRTAWMKREGLLRFLFDQLQLETQGDQGVVEVFFNSSCTKIEGKAGELVCTLESKKARSFETLSTPLLIGSDGIHSVVRETLERWETDKKKTQKDMFALNTIPCVSSGMRFKALHLDMSKLPTFEPCPISRSEFGVIKGTKGRNMGMLPTGDAGKRLCGCARFPTDAIWLVESVSQLYEHLQEHFPQVDWAKVLDTEQAQAWVKSEGSRFPAAQFCEGLVSVLGEEAGVCLVGDALHCFPPDLGMGVNAALEDVLFLYSAFRETMASSSSSSSTTTTTTTTTSSSSTICIKKGLQLYSERRAKDVHAICSLLPIGMPYQYSQPADVTQYLWYAGFIIRLLASAALPSFVHPPVARLVSDPRFSYLEVLQLHQSNTYRIAGIGLGALLAVGVAFFLKFGIV